MKQLDDPIAAGEAFLKVLEEAPGPGRTDRIIAAVARVNEAFAGDAPMGIIGESPPPRTAKRPKTMAEAATAFWGAYAARHGRTAPEADGVDRSVAPGHTPGHEAVALLVDAKRRPRSK